MTQQAITNGTATNGAPVALAKAAAPTHLDSLKKNFESWKPSIRAVLPRHLDADRVIKMAISAYMRSEHLQKCTVKSIIRATIQAAELGLEPSGLLGECALVPMAGKEKYKDGNVWKDRPVTEAVLMPMYKGLVKLARQSGEVSSISAYVVDKSDEFNYQLGLNPNIHHIPNLDTQTGEIVAVYCVVRYKDGGTHFEVMSKPQVDAIRARSRSGGEGSAWATDYGEMAKKTVIKRTLKMVTLSPEKPHTAAAVQADNAFETGEAFNTEATEALDALTEPPQLAAAQPTTRTSRLADQLASKVADAEYDPETGEVKQ